MRRRNGIRALFWSVLLVMLAACGDSDGAGSGEAGDGSSEQLQVAYITAAETSVGNYEIAHVQSFEKMADKYEFETTVVEKTDYARAPEVMRDLASRGFDAIIVNSGGFATALAEVAAEFPETWFIGTSDITDPSGTSNMAGFVPNWDQLGYVTAAAVAEATGTNQVGIVTGEPILSLNRIIGNIMHYGVAFNPELEVEVRFTQSFVDNAKSKEASLALIADGTDVLIPMIGSAEPGVFEAAKAEDALLVGYYVDAYEQAPEIVFTSQLVVTDFGYDELGGLLSSDSLEPKIYPLDVANGGLDYAKTRGTVPEAVQAAIDGAIQDIKSGDVEVESHPYEP